MEAARQVAGEAAPPTRAAPATKGIGVGVISRARLHGNVLRYLRSRRQQPPGLQPSRHVSGSVDALSGSCSPRWRSRPAASAAEHESETGRFRAPPSGEAQENVRRMCDHPVCSLHTSLLPCAPTVRHRSGDGCGPPHTNLERPPCRRIGVAFRLQHHEGGGGALLQGISQAHCCC